MRFSSSLQALRRFIPRGRFGRSVAVLAGGTALGQIIVVLASPILTRLYGPDDFGVMAVYVSLLGIFSVVASLRYQLAIPLPREDGEAANVLTLSLAIVLLVSLSTGFVVWLFGGRIAEWVNAPALRPHLWLLPLGVGMVGTYQIFSYWAMRKRAFNQIARTKIFQGLGSVLTQLGLGFLGLGPIGLLLGQVVGQTAGTTALATLAWKRDGEDLRRVHASELRRMAIRYKRFPLFSSWSAVLNALSVQVPTLMLSLFFGSAITGLYALSYRVMSLPMQFVGHSVAQVFLPTAVEAQRSGSIATTTEAIFKSLVQIAAPTLLLFALAAPELFAIVFGQKWLEAGIYTQWLAPWMFLLFVSAPLSMLPSVMEKQVQEASFHGVLLLSRVGALSIGGLLNSERVAVGAFAGVSTLCWFIYVLWAVRLSGNKIRRVLAIVFREALAILPLALPVVLAKMLTDRDLYVLGATGLSSVFVLLRWAKKLRSRGGDEAEETGS